MYIEILPNKGKGTSPYVLLRESVWKNGKSVKITIKNISGWKREKIDALKLVLAGKTQIGVSKFRITRSLPHGAVHAVLGTMKKLGFPQLIAAKKSKKRDIAMGLIAQRIIAPSSKITTFDAFTKETQKNTLAEELDIADIKKYQIYAAMDYLLSKKGIIEKRLAKKHLRKNCLVLYDLTSVFFEGETCPLMKIGRGKNGAYEPQILVGLLTNSEGVPVGTEVFEGNLLDHQTLLGQIQKVKETYGIKKVIIIGDRGTIIAKRIEEIKRQEDILFITALTAPQIQQLVSEKAIQLSLFDRNDMAEIIGAGYPGERLIACRNPFLQKERSRVREELLQATERELNKIVTATQRKRRQLKEKAAIGVRVGKVINKYKMGKHFTFIIEEGMFSYQRNRQTIRKEEILDGIYVIRTTVAKEEATDERTVELYKNLAFVERSFRCMKTTDLSLRPIYHHLETRVKSHVFLCMLSFYVEYSMRKALSPIIFQEEDEEKRDMQKKRKSIVAPAIRSEGAKMKDKTRQTADKQFPVQSFKSLLLDLSTLTRNTIEPLEITKRTFKQLSEPTPLQKRAFAYLQVQI